MSDEKLWVRMVDTGKVEQLPYRKAVGLLSRGLAVTAERPKNVRAEKAPAKGRKDAEGPSEDAQDDKKDLSAPARKGQEGENAENEPPSKE